MAKAKARVGDDERGRLNVFARGIIDGRVRRRRLAVPDNDRDLAEETARELNRRFSLGDYSWLLPDPKTARRRPAAKRQHTLEEWADKWLEDIHGQIGEHTWRTYRSNIRYLVTHLGSRRLGEITPTDLTVIRKRMVKEGRKDPTIKDRLGLLRAMFQDARRAGLIDSSPFDVPMPKRRTKRQRREKRSKQVTFRPLVADEITKLLKVVRSPKGSTDRLWFSITEFLILTGLRWGEAAGVMWSDVSETGGLIHIHRAVEQYGPPDPNAPTKTGAEWSIPLRPPLADLLRRQRARTFVGNTEGWIFPSQNGSPLDYANWRKRGWQRVLLRAKVSPREGDAQKALRRAYITSSLVCGRNPKQVAGELGHTNARMVIDVYDSFLDPANWPDRSEIERLINTYGWQKPFANVFLDGTHMARMRADPETEKTPPS